MSASVPIGRFDLGSELRLGLRGLDNNNSVGLSGFAFFLVVKLLGLRMGMATTTMSFDGVRNKAKFLCPLRSFLMPAAIKKEVEEVPVFCTKESRL